MDQPDELGCSYCNDPNTSKDVKPGEDATWCCPCCGTYYLPDSSEEDAE